jgi:hypothetical protein
MSYRSGPPVNRNDDGISQPRKTAYYAGGALMAVGLIMFLSTFVISMVNFGNFSDFVGRVREAGCLAIGGMILMMLGGFIRGIGARGLAGSGLKLDPEQARDDLKPYARMAGGLIKDAVSEFKDSPVEAAPVAAVKIRCLKCRALNDESAKFCGQCAAPI